MKTENIAIERAVALLNAAGAQFKIIAKDGTEYGALQTKPIPKRKRTGFDFAAIYKERASAMQPGDVQMFTAPDGMPVESLRGAIAGYACQKWGRGNHISTVAGRNVEVLRIQ